MSPVTATGFERTPGRRVVLRALRDSDAATLWAYRTEPEIARYQSWDTNYSQDEATELVSSMTSADFGVRGSWYQVGIALSESDRLIGDLAVFFDPDNEASVEIGFTLSPEAQGRGYASEALALLLPVLVKSQDILEVRAVTDVRNHPSRRLLARLGFVEGEVVEKSAYYKGEWCDEVECLWRPPPRSGE